jgi:hypothetical protein
MAGTWNIAFEKELGSAALTVAVLILFLVLVLAGLLLLILLAGLALLRLAGLGALLLTEVTLFLHIVCHTHTLLRKARNLPRLWDLSAIYLP